MFLTPPPTHYYVILLRHGESIGNAEGIYQGQADYSLSDLGREQVTKLARRWQAAGTTFDQIITSPLARARQSADIISQFIKIPVVQDPLWMERDVGLISGLPPEEADKKYPRPAFMHPYYPAGVTGESQWELFLRGGHAIQDLLKRPLGRYLIVSHGGILNMVLYGILGITPQANFTGPRFQFSNTGFATLTYTPEEHAWRVIGINNNTHLHT